jgi:hypothetical protein
MLQISKPKNKEYLRLVKSFMPMEAWTLFENMFYSIEFRVKEEIGKEAKPYRSWWNGISTEWKY